MRGKKVVNNNPIIYKNPLKLQQTKTHNRLKLKEVKSVESKFNNYQPINYQKKPNQDKIYPTAVPQYELSQRNRENHHYIPINKPFYQILNKNSDFPVNRIQKNIKVEQPMHLRTNNFIQQKQNSYSSHNSSLTRMKIFSAEPNQRASSRSSNTSAKKKGIEITKTLLRKISGMYTDKDFQNKSSYSNKSHREETTGIMTTSGKGLYDYDEYQMSDFDIQSNHQHNHLYNLENSNTLSFRDSAHLRPNQNSYNPPMRKNEIPNSRIIYENLLKNSFNPPKQELHKVKSYEFLNSKSNTQSIVVGQQPPQRFQMNRRNNGGNREQDYEKYLIHSKNKTMDELSVKESMIFGFESYYQ